MFGRSRVRGLYIVALEQLDDSRGRARLRPVASRYQQAHIIRMETVDVFLRSYRKQDSLRIDVRRERKLDQNSIDLGSFIQLRNKCQKLVSRDGSGRRQSLAEH